MKYGFVIPGGDLPTVLELASEAEVADWDGVFYWDAIHIGAVERIYDARFAFFHPEVDRIGRAMIQ